MHVTDLVMARYSRPNYTKIRSYRTIFESEQTYGTNNCTWRLKEEEEELENIWKRRELFILWLHPCLKNAENPQRKKSVRTADHPMQIPAAYEPLYYDIRSLPWHSHYMNQNIRYESRVIHYTDCRKMKFCRYHGIVCSVSEQVKSSHWSVCDTAAGSYLFFYILRNFIGIWTKQWSQRLILSGDEVL
jgi:hypothetical protein